jgi:hypothetical protein
VRIDFGREQTERKQKKKTQARVVKKLLKNVEKKLGGEDVKASLGDYIRLMQLQKELEEEPEDITVTWVEPDSGDATTAWTKEAQFAQGRGFESVVLFALDQMCLIGYELPLSSGFRRSVRLGS